MSNQPQTPAAAVPAASTPSTFKKIAIEIETDAKHVVLTLWRDRALEEEALTVLGAGRAAAFIKELISLGKTAVTAYEDASHTEITPASIQALLPDTTPIPAPAQPPTDPPTAPADAAK